MDFQWTQNMNPSSFSSFHSLQNASSSSSFNSLPETKGHSHLHSIRRPPLKAGRRSGSNGLPDKLYVVHPSRFRKLVQELTGDPKFTSRRLRDAAPAPLRLIPKRAVPLMEQEYTDTRLQLQTPFSSAPEKLFTDASSQFLPQPPYAAEPVKESDRCFGPFGMFSPNSCSFQLLSPIFSPGTMALLEQSAVP